MPELVRQPLRMDCTGLDLVHPPDRMPPGAFSYLFNCRVLEEGRIDGRPGYSSLIGLETNDLPNSIRRLNDPDDSYASAGYTYVGGGGTKLYAGPESTYSPIDTGYSGDPLSLIPFRPDQSPESWMYVYDRQKLVKVRPDSAIRPVGVVPPNSAPATEYGPPALVELDSGQSTSGWTSSGDISSITLVNREGTGVTSSIQAIVYNSGTSGWACLVPTSSSPLTWAGDRMQVLLNSGGGNAETVFLREIHPAIVATTIAGIIYDSGTSGPCSIVLVNSPTGIARNSLLVLNSAETVRVLSVTLSPDGVTYSIRASTAGTFSASQSVTGLLSWYVYTTLTHAASESISSSCVYAHGSSLGSAKSITNTIYRLFTLDASKASGRPIDLANDYCHLSLWVTNAPALVSVQLVIDVDANTTSISNAFMNNYFVATLSPAQIFGPVTPGGGAWYKVLVPLSQFIRAGDDPTRTLANIQGLQIRYTVTGVTDLAFDYWYLFGTYGPFVQPNSPIGLLYESRDRDSSTGAVSVPGPFTRHELFPVREEILVTPAATTASGVDSLDVYRQGSTLPDFTYVGTVVNNSGSPNVFSDNQPDSSLSGSPQADTSLLQPWVTLGLAWSGTVNVTGTSVTWVSGTKFNLSLVADAVILINGIAYQIRGQPKSATFLEIILSAGVLVNATFLVASPEIAGSPLPFAFGPLEGPFSPVIFGLGDPINGGNLYFTNSANADAQADTNVLELSGPSEELISGATWNGLVFTGSRENVFCVRYSYLQNPSIFQDTKIPSPSGMWSRWACQTTPFGVAFLGRDGIYLASDQGAVNITDERLYPLFPHDGQAASAVNAGGNVILPVDMTRLTQLRLDYCDQDLLFSYLDTAGNPVVLRYEFSRKRWFIHSFADSIRGFYLIEGDAAGPNSQEILLIGRSVPSIFLSGGSTDNGAAIESLVLTPSSDGGDERAQKLYVDAMVQYDGIGSLSVSAAFDNAQAYSPVVAIPAAGSIQQSQVNLASLSDLSLHRNIGMKFAWTGGPTGPRIYAFEPSAYAQPFLSQRLTTQFLNLSFPAWKSHRRIYAGLISNSPVNLTIETQDGRVFGPYEIPSSNGRFRIFPFLVDHGLKDLAFAYQLDGMGQTFAVFQDSFTIETKSWDEPSFVQLAVYKT